MAGTAAGIVAAVDIEAAHTGAVVGHTQVARTAAAAVAEDTVVDHTEVVIGRMQVAHTVVAVAANNPVDHTVSDTAAAVVGIARSA